MSTELDKLKRSIQSYVKMTEAARAEKSPGKVTSVSPTSSETVSPSPTSEHSPNKSPAPSV